AEGLHRLPYGSRRADGATRSSVGRSVPAAKVLPMEGYNFSTDVVVRFAETDAQGIAHHASFVVWLEVARVSDLTEYAGGYRGIQAHGIEALTTEVQVRYHRAAHFDERLTVWTRCVDLRG